MAHTQALHGVERSNVAFRALSILVVSGGRRGFLCLMLLRFLMPRSDQFYMIQLVAGVVAILGSYGRRVFAGRYN
jgi:hypothetical protein